LLEVVVGDIEQRILQIELDVGLHHRHGERQARRRAVGLGRRDTRACGGEQRAVATPEIQVPAEVERHTTIVDITAAEGWRKQVVLGVALARRLGIRGGGRQPRGACRDRLSLGGAQPRLRRREARTPGERLIDECIELQVAVTPPPAIGRPGGGLDL